MRKAGLLLVALASLSAAGCAHMPKEKSAPCKRPANALAYVPAECGPMKTVNNDAAAVLAAIDALGGN